MCKRMWIDSIQRESTMRNDAVRNMPSSVSLSKFPSLSNGYMFTGKMEELTRENAKILQKIVEAR